MTGINAELAASRDRIADIERQIEALNHRIAQHTPDSAQARYARTALDVLERSLRLMCAQRDRIACELKRQQREARRNSRRRHLRVTRARLEADARKARLLSDRDWYKRAGA